MIIIWIVLSCVSFPGCYLYLKKWKGDSLDAPVWALLSFVLFSITNIVTVLAVTIYYLTSIFEK
jgi:hypothetical protein